MRYRISFATKLIVAIVTLLVAVIVSCLIGSVKISIKDILRVLVDSPNVGRTSKIILLKVRLPRILMSALVGGSLASTGAVMQGLFKNPMADPSVLGISSGSAFGATVAIVFGISASWWGMSSPYIGALIGALVTLVIIFGIARACGDYDLNSTLLAGIAISSVLSALTTLLMTLRRDNLEAAYMWILGSFSGATVTRTIIIAVLVLIVMPILILVAPQIDILKLGRESAQGLGISVTSLTRLLLGLTSLIVAFCVANSGAIGFVGLIIPHCVSFMRVYRMRQKLILSFVVGALFCVICDTIARTIIAPSEIAIGTITSIIGAPYFLILLLKNIRKGRQG